MATIKCTVDRSDRFEMYIEYTVSQDPITAKSVITHALKLKQLTDGADFNGNMNVTYKIGTESFSYNANLNIDDKGNAGYTVTIISDTTTIQHNVSTGTGSFWVECSGVCNSAGYGPGNISLKGQSIALPTIDRAAPTVSLVISNIAVSSLTITATSNARADRWEYSIDNGSSWVQFSTTAGTSASKIVTGLLPNATYNVKVRARRAYNQVYGTSSMKSATTLGNSILNSVSTLVVDMLNPVLSMNWTVYDNYTHTLVIKDGATTVLTMTGLTCGIGTNNISITLSSEQRITILRYMSDTASFKATFTLTTYDGVTQIGNTVSLTAIIETTADTSAPAFTGFTHCDNNDKTVSVTGNAQCYIKGYSALMISIDSVTAQNESSIAYYRVTVGSVSKSFATPDIEFGTIDASGNVNLKVEVIDSRGHTSAIDETISVVDYSDVSITDYTIRRKNEVEPTVQLAFSGDLSPVYVDGVAKNKIVSSRFRYAVAGGQWSTWESLTVAYTSYSFEFATLALSKSDGVIEFDSNSQFTLEIEVTDTLSHDNITLILNRGKPLMSLRNKKVGINTADPQGALDVRDGNILMNGFNVMGFVRSLTDNESLDEIMDNGIYTQFLNNYARVDRGYPTEKAGFLEVITMPEGQVLQKYTTVDGTGIYIRQYMEAWSDWCLIAGPSLVDYIVEQGSDGIWTYRKWSSGLAECWAKKTYTNVLFNMSWGNCYYSNVITDRLNYPFVFIETPVEQARISARNNAVWTYSEASFFNTTTYSGCYRGIRPVIGTESGQEMYFDLFVIGKWK